MRGLGTMKFIRRFNGKEYRAMGWTSKTKAGAREAAERLRQPPTPYLVRVVKVGKEYYLFARQRRK